MNEYISVLLRCLIIFILLIIIIRLLGKREVGELSIFDLVVILIISDIGAMGIDEKDLFIPAILCLILLLILQKTFSYILLKISSLRNIVDGSSRVLIFEGEILFGNFKKESYTIDDLLSQIHKEGILDISEVNLAILETSGNLAVFSCLRYPKVSLPVIVSKKIVKENLKLLDIKEDFIYDYLNNNNINIKDVAYMSSYKDGIKDYYLFDKKRK